MTTISFVFVLSTVVASMGFVPSKTDDLKLNDNFNYEFHRSNEFDKTNGDEFELLNLADGGKSEIEIINDEGVSTVLKEESSSPELIPDDRAHSLTSYNDSKEENDFFDTATSTYDVGYYEDGIYIMASWLDATISQKTKGWWLWEEKYVDKDFYSFDSCVYGTITVTMTNIPANCDYDLRAYKLEDGSKVKATDLGFDDYIAISQSGAGKDEQIVLSATPGTYFFCVYSYQDKTYDNDNPYHLHFEQKVNDTTRANTHYNIDDGKEQGDLGAIWISDYKPLGYTPITLSNNNAVVNVTNYDDYPYIRHLANKYTNGSYINYAVIYVWDVSTRACISAVAQQLVELVESETDWNDEDAKTINIAMNTAGLILTVAGIAVGVASAAVTAGIAAAALTAAGFLINPAAFTVSLASFAMSFSSNAPYLATRKDLLAYLVSVQQTFSVGKGSNENETKMLRYRYRFDKDTHALNWSPFYSASDYNFYNEDSISFQIKNSGIDGTVRGFKEESDLKNYLEA